jgi:hypothetical protein
MSYSIQVSNEENNLTWEKRFAAPEEVEQVRGFSEGRDFICLLCGTFKPIRTNTCKTFAEDFFFPTLVNYALKVKSVVGKIFAILTALVLDIITLPLRLLTAIPRAIANKIKGEHPLRKYLIAQNVDKKLLEGDHVTVQFKGVQDGAPYELIQNINFIERPCDTEDDN